jgi:hypothetical protein
VKAKSTNFDSWAVTFTGTKDHDYLQAKSDISAYEVFERRETDPHRRTQRVATHPIRQITGDGSSTPERNIKAYEIDPQTITYQGGKDTRDPTGKTSFMEQTTTHQNEGEDNEGITRTKRAPREISMPAVEKALQEGTPKGPAIATPTQE